MSNTLADLFKDKFNDDVEETQDGWLVHCPAHNDSQRSLRFAVSKDGKVLVKDRAGCTTPDVMTALGMTMRDLAQMTPGAVDLGKTARSTANPAGGAEIAKMAVTLDQYAKDLDTESLTYLQSRFGVTEEQAKALGIGTGEFGGGKRVVIPFRDKDGIARNFQGRALFSPVKARWQGPSSPDGASWSKIGYFPADTGWNEVIISEGPGDALTAFAQGYDSIGVAGASNATNPQVVEQIAEIVGDRLAIVAGDGDPAGRKFSAALSKALAEKDVTVAVLDPGDGLDLTDWRQQEGSNFDRAFIRAVAEAKSVSSVTASLQAWDEDRYALNDLGGARYLRDYIESIGSGVKYTAETGFYLLDGGIWLMDVTQRTRTYAQEVADLVRELAKDAAQDPNVAIQGSPAQRRSQRLNRYAGHVQTTRGIDSMIRELQAVRGVPATIEDFDKHGDLLAVKNGVIDLRTGVLRPHDAGLMLSKRLEIEYDPSAKAPRWEQFLDEVFPNHPDLAGYMQRLIGYGITGRSDEQCFAVFWGNGANGKSVFTDTLNTVFGAVTVATPFSTFEDKQSGGIPNDIAALKGARLVLASEGEQGRPMAEAVLKRVTGSENVTARFMRREFFSFKPVFLLMLATNFKPSFKGQDEGLWRRVKLIPWERYFKPEERDHRLAQKLVAEGPGILAWAVRGSIEWYSKGLGDPETVVNATQEYRATSDALNGFLPGLYTKDQNAGRVVGKTLFEDYLNWADEENLPSKERWTRRAFFAALEERGFPKRNTNKGVAFDGIRRTRPSDHKADEPEVAHPTEPVVPSKQEVGAVTGADIDQFI